MTLPTKPNLLSLLLPVLILYFSIFIATAGMKTKDEEYTYAEGTKNGPANWWRLNPQWKACGNGKLQSPIEIIDKSVVELPQLGELKLDHKPAPSILKNRGHDIMVQWNGDAGQLEINGTYYKLIQCHWHTPSEHKLNGIKFDMEIHVVHQNTKGEIAVIGIWYKIGGPDPFLSKLINNIKSIGDKEIDLGVINPSDISFISKMYYRYVGSLTTPPCTEGVIWTVMKEVRTVSTEQLDALKGAVHHGFKENARPTQELNGRQVWSYTP
ncbi:alpha carbonic anhydrase 4-like [Abrus precatorius]|uniref:Carbonic anhydrase n=1 Tax=Abrus precatorius TaxID=3816 RepID=A0A8B8KZR3_ABRPR|nr:alpha carbonic anhydrase 4-like [Abrus precatorius]